MEAPQPTPDPVARRIRAYRAAAGLSLRALADQATGILRSRGQRSGRGSSLSAAYLSLIENGHKVPDEAIAVAIATALADDPALYRAWVAARKRADLPTVLAAAETLRRMPAGAPGATRPGAARLRVPVIAPGDDPGDGVRPACAVIAWRRLDASALADDDHARLDRPFAFRLDPVVARRTPELLDLGDHALMLRSFLPLASGAVHAVRHDGHVVLSRLLWNGRQLLLLPEEGAGDFVVLEAGDESRLRALVVGVAVVVRFEPEEERR